MGDLLIRDLPEALRQQIARAARMKGESLSSTAVDLLREGLLAKQQHVERRRESGWEMLRSLFEEGGGGDGEFAKIMDEIEAERKRDPGRPVDLGGVEDS